MAQAIVNKLLHGPTARLKAAASTGDGDLPGAAAELFGIDNEPTRPEGAPAQPPRAAPRPRRSEARRTRR